MVVGSGAGLRFAFLLVCTAGGDGGPAAVCFSTRSLVALCVRLWFAAFRSALLASLARTMLAPSIVLNFSKSSDTKRNSTIQNKDNPHIFHLEQNQRNLTLHKKSPRCER
jgi:hypothetical protein